MPNALKSQLFPQASTVTADTRWLDEDEQQTWRAFLTAQRLLFDRLERQLQREAGLPHAYYDILVLLSEAPDRRCG
jgi:hypothetical protein